MLSPVCRTHHPVTVTQMMMGVTGSLHFFPMTTWAWGVLCAVLLLACGHRCLLSGPQGQSVLGLGRVLT